MRGAVAGTIAAALWAVAEPLGQRILRTPYSDARLLGALFTRGRAWRPIGLLSHLMNGAVFGAAFARFGGHGWRRGVLAAEMENILLWPTMAVFDRIHPDRRSGGWSPLLSSVRVFVYEAMMHGLFGVVLGVLTTRPARRTLDRSGQQ